jgi:hypothetical protein
MTMREISGVSIQGLGVGAFVLGTAGASDGRSLGWAGLAAGVALIFASYRVLVSGRRTRAEKQ